LPESRAGFIGIKIMGKIDFSDGELAWTSFEKRLMS
jgi:hypothetical protein